MTTNRDALLDAAVRCLRDRGYAGTSARDLVAASGTNLGAIGYHFGSKEALLNEAIAVSVSRWIEALGDLVRQQVASGSDLRAVLDDLFAVVREDSHLVTAFFEALGRAGRVDDLRAQLAVHYERYRNDVADALRPLIATAGTADDRAVSSLLLALGDGLIIQCLLDPTTVPGSSQLLEAIGSLPYVAGVGRD